MDLHGQQLGSKQLGSMLVPCVVTYALHQSTCTTHVHV
jgi:hypothetical protein